MSGAAADGQLPALLVDVMAIAIEAILAVRDSVEDVLTFFTTQSVNSLRRPFAVATLASLFPVPLGALLTH